MKGVGHLKLLTVVIMMFYCSTVPARSETFHFQNEKETGTDLPGRHRYVLKNGAIEIDLVSGWKSALGLFSMPLQLLGPDHARDQNVSGEIDSENFEAERTMMAVIPGPKMDAPVKFSESEYRADYTEFLESKKKDLKEMAADFDREITLEALTFSCISQYGLATSLQVIKMGIEFHIENLAFLDFTYHVACKNQIFILKVLYPKKDYESDHSQVEQMLRSFSCD